MVSGIGALSEAAPGTETQPEWEFGFVVAQFEGFEQALGRRLKTEIKDDLEAIPMADLAGGVHEWAQCAISGWMATGGVGIRAKSSAPNEVMKALISSNSKPKRYPWNHATDR